MRTDQRRNEDLTRLKSIGGLFVCAAELTYIMQGYSKHNAPNFIMYEQIVIVACIMHQKEVQL